MILIAHNIRSLHNVGSIFRSANAFDVEKLYLTGYTGKPPRKEIAKVSLKSEYSIDWEAAEDITELINTLKTDGIKIVALDNVPGATSIHEFQVPKKLALILGNEVEGIEDEILTLCDSVLMIPTSGHKQSLNVSVATGIALFALTSKAG